MADGIAAIAPWAPPSTTTATPGTCPSSCGDPAVEAGRVEVRGDASSQFLSGLLLVGPALPGGLRLQVDGPLVSELRRPDGVGDAGVRRQGRVVGRRRARRGPGRLPRHPLRGRARTRRRPRTCWQRRQWCRAPVTITGVGDACRATGASPTCWSAWGADVVRRPGSVKVRGGAPLHGITADLADLSDVAQTLAVVAAVADGPDRAHRHRLHPPQGDRPHRQRRHRAAPLRHRGQRAP
ncbi:MAG: hypothetical protein V9G12_21145 [Microthrixaceae bacterium]